MNTIFPQKISQTAIYLYLGALLMVSVVFFSHAMKTIYIVLGVIWVVGFFLLSSYFSREWQQLTKQQYQFRLFGIAVLFRFAWVIFSYFFYLSQNGDPFEFSAADSMVYHSDAEWLATEDWSVISMYLIGSGMRGVSDAGYPLYLTALYKIIGPNIFLARVVKCFISAGTCIFMYKIAARNFGESVGRMAGIFGMLMPNLIIYCGLHLKETEMIFLSMAFLNSADYLVHSRDYHIWTIAIPFLLAVSLFFFRTVLGAVAVFSYLTAIVFTTERLMGKAKRAVLITWVVLAGAFLLGGTIRTEVESLWEERDSNVVAKRNYQTSKGNKWAKYATGSVMAPMALFLPYPTMVDVDFQYNQQIMHGGNYVRNFLGAFVLIAIFSALFVKKNWRDLSLIGSFVFGYLGAISMSGFSNSERFLLPGAPILLIMAAYGLSLVNIKNYKFVQVWYVVVVMMSLSWAYFKIGSRGLL